MQSFFGLVVFFGLPSLSSCLAVIVTVSSPLVFNIQMCLTGKRGTQHLCLAFGDNFSLKLAPALPPPSLLLCATSHPPSFTGNPLTQQHPSFICHLGLFLTPIVSPFFLLTAGLQCILIFFFICAIFYPLCSLCNTAPHRIMSFVLGSNLICLLSRLLSGPYVSALIVSFYLNVCHFPPAIKRTLRCQSNIMK